MSDSILKEGTTEKELVRDLALLSLKIAKLTSKIEVYLGEEYLPAEYRLMFYEMYLIANRHFKSDDPDAGKLYDDKELASLQEQVKKHV